VGVSDVEKADVDDSSPPPYPDAVDSAIHASVNFHQQIVSYLDVSSM
jgi:hypothetical protein